MSLPEYACSSFCVSNLQGEVWTSDEEDPSSDTDNDESSVSDSETSSQTAGEQRAAAEQGSARPVSGQGATKRSFPPVGLPAPNFKRKCEDLDNAEWTPVAATTPALPRLSLNGKRLGRPRKYPDPAVEDFPSEQIRTVTPQKATLVKGRRASGSAATHRAAIRSGARQGKSGGKVVGRGSTAAPDSHTGDAESDKEDSDWSSGVDNRNRGHFRCGAAQVIKCACIAHRVMPEIWAVPSCL